MATYSDSLSWTHAGLMDGLNGLDPNPRLKHVEYTTGWSTGCQMREEGFVVPKYYGYCEPLPAIPQKSQVTIKKGTHVSTLGNLAPNKTAQRTYKVIVRSINNGSPAYLDHRTGQIVLPTNPHVVYAGAGSYWHWVDLNDVPEAL